MYEDEEDDRDSEEKDVKKDKAAVPESQDVDKTQQEVEGLYHTVASFISLLPQCDSLMYISGPVHCRGF